VIKREEIQPDHGRVTAGIPSLDSPKRFQKDSELVSKDYAQKIEQETRSGDEACLNPDGERPSTILGASEGIKLPPAEFIRRLTAINPNFWFERSKSMPTEMCACIKVPISEDHPKGLWFQFGFSAERPLIEWNWSHEKTKLMHTRGIGLVKEKFACHGCDECKKEGAFFGRIRGWRSLLQILMENKIITSTDIVEKFGNPNEGISKNWKTVIHGS